MTTHLNDDCPSMNQGDEILDIDNLEDDEWVYDCEVCLYAENRIERAWEGGFINGLQLALNCRDVIQSDTEAGRSKLQIFQLLLNEWSDRELVWIPHPLPLLIMTPEEVMAYSCPACEKLTSYARTEDTMEVWVCHDCGHEIRKESEDQGR